jgi:hypothetical protein
MATAQAMPLSLLYERDETAWLEEMSRLAAEGRFAEMDHRNLSEYLADMAKRDRREVFSRLVVLLTHLLKWAHQPDRRSESWIGTIAEQRRELRMMLESGVLRNHAISILAEAYEDARKQAAAETGLPRSTFPLQLDRDLDVLLAEEEETL